MSVALAFLRKSSRILRVDGCTIGRGRRPVRYFPLLRPFVLYTAKMLKSKQGKRLFFGKRVSRKSNRKETTFIKERDLKDGLRFEKVSRTPPTKQFVRLFPEEKERLDKYLREIGLRWVRRKGKMELIWASPEKKN